MAPVGAPCAASETIASCSAWITGPARPGCEPSRWISGATPTALNPGGNTMYAAIDPSFSFASPSDAWIVVVLIRLDRLSALTTATLTGPWSPLAIPTAGADVDPRI